MSAGDLSHAESDREGEEGHNDPSHTHDSWAAGVQTVGKQRRDTSLCGITLSERLAPHVHLISLTAMRQQLELIRHHANAYQRQK